MPKPPTWLAFLLTLLTHSIPGKVYSFFVCTVYVEFVFWPNEPNNAFSQQNMESVKLKKRFEN